MANAAGRSIASLGLVTWLGLALGLGGCGRGRLEPAAPTKLSANPTSREVLDAMAARYRQARTYQDTGRLRLRFDRGGQKVDDAADFSVAFERPNKLRLHCYQATALCDGRMLRASLMDLPGQILAVPAPPALSITALHADPVLAGVLTQGIAGGAPQLALLLERNAVNEIVGEGRIEPLEKADLEGQACYLVRISRADGQLLLWIDADHLVLRRIDYPVVELARQLQSESPTQDVQLVAEFTGAQIDHALPALAFQYEAPEGVRLVTQLDQSLIPPPAPSELLGKDVADFHFTMLDGSTVDRARLSGRVAVLDFWATWCEPCRESLPKLAELRRRYGDRVEFLAVSLDEAGLANADVQASLDKLAVDVPIARDADQSAAKAFHVESIPNLVVIGPTGRIEWQELGFNPELVEQMGPRLERLLAGSEIWREAVDEYEQRKARYEQALGAGPTVR